VKEEIFILIVSLLAIAIIPFSASADFLQTFDNFTNAWYIAGTSPYESVDSAYGVTFWQAIDEGFMSLDYATSGFYCSNYPTAADSQVNVIPPGFTEPQTIGLFYASNSAPTNDPDEVNTNRYQSRGFFAQSYPEKWWDPAAGGPVYYPNPLFDNLQMDMMFNFDVYNACIINFDPYIEIIDKYGNKVIYDTYTSVECASRYKVDWWNLGDQDENFGGNTYHFDFARYSSISYAAGYDETYTAQDIFDNAKYFAIYTFGGDTLDNSYKSFPGVDLKDSLRNAPGLYYIDNFWVDATASHMPEPISVAYSLCGFATIFGLRMFKK
jgi:hypothetical protein